MNIAKRIARAALRQIFDDAVADIRSEERAAAVADVVDMITNAKGNIYANPVKLYGDHQTISNNIFLRGRNQTEPALILEK